MNSVVKSATAAQDRSGEQVSMAEAAYRAIQDRLIRLDIRPGAPVNEEELCQRLGLSRTPVREALKRLEHERLIVVYPRRGTFATEINVTDLTYIFEIRELMEPAAAAGAARRATQAERAGFRVMAGELAEQLRPGERPDELMALDMRIHRAVYAATHNPYLEDTLIRYGNLATRIWCVFLDRLPGMADHVGEHAQLLAALADGDAGQAAEIARRHVIEFDKAVRAVI